MLPYIRQIGCLALANMYVSITVRLVYVICVMSDSKPVCIQSRESDPLRCIVSYETVLAKIPYSCGMLAVLKSYITTPSHFTSNIIVQFANIKGDLPRFFLNHP